MSEVLLVGGPRDGTTLDVGDAALVTLDIGGLTHRYIKSNKTQDVGGQQLPVYPYDGEVRQGEGVVQHEQNPENRA